MYVGDDTGFCSIVKWLLGVEEEEEDGEEGKKKDRL